jgi:excisionase family DNA binding protein
MQYFDVSQVAKKLGIARSTVYRLIEAGELKAGRFGLKNGIRISEKELLRFKREREGTTSKL